MKGCGTWPVLLGADFGCFATHNSNHFAGTTQLDQLGLFSDWLIRGLYSVLCVRVCVTSLNSSLTVTRLSCCLTPHFCFIYLFFFWCILFSLPETHKICLRQTLPLLACYLNHRAAALRGSISSVSVFLPAWCYCYLKPRSVSIHRKEEKNG